MTYKCHPVVLPRSAERFSIANRNESERKKEPKFDRGAYTPFPSPAIRQQAHAANE